MRLYFWVFLAVLLCVLHESCEASSDYGFHLNEVSLDYARFKEGSRDAILAPSRPKERVDLNVNLDLLRYFYLNNQVHSMTDTTQFRLIGWKYQLGVHLGSFADLYYQHFSQHILDQAYNDFPLENTIGLKLYLYRR